MPPLSLLLLHEIFPSFPPLWEFLVAGLVLGGAITAIVRRQRRPRIDRLSRLEGAVEAHSSSRSSSGAVPGREFFGVPWTIPGYALLVVLVGGALSLAVPIASFVIAPGYIFMFIVAFRSSSLDHAPGFLPYLLIVVGSWAFWTLCAGVVWRVTRRLSGEAPPPSGPARLNIGGPRA
jgi:hypothetical protein